MRNFVLLLCLLFALSCVKHAAPPPPVAVAPPVLPQFERLNALYENFQGFRDNPLFARYGFTFNSPYADWLQQVQRLERDPELVDGARTLAGLAVAHRQHGEGSVVTRRYETRFARIVRALPEEPGGPVEPDAAVDTAGAVETPAAVAEIPVPVDDAAVADAPATLDDVVASVVQNPVPDAAPHATVAESPSVAADTPSAEAEAPVPTVEATAAAVQAVVPASPASAGEVASDIAAAPVADAPVAESVAPAPAAEEGSVPPALPATAASVPVADASVAESVPTAPAVENGTAQSVPPSVASAAPAADASVTESVPTAPAVENGIAQSGPSTVASAAPVADASVTESVPTAPAAEEGTAQSVPPSVAAAAPIADAPVAESVPTAPAAEDGTAQSVPPTVAAAAPVAPVVEADRPAGDAAATGQSPALSVGAPVAVQSLPVASTVAGSAKSGITFVFSGDTQGVIFPQPGVAGPVGGLARRPALLGRIRAEEPGTVLVDAGDAFASGFGRAGRINNVLVRAMNRMGYDAMGLGPYDLAVGEVALRELVSIAEFPFVCSNLVFQGGVKPWIKPYAILRRGPFRIGVISLLPPDAGAAVTGARLVPPGHALRSVLAELGPKVDGVVLLTQMGSAEVAGMLDGLPVSFVAGDGKAPSRDVPLYLPAVPKGLGFGRVRLEPAEGGGLRPVEHGPVLFGEQQDGQVLRLLEELRN